MFQINEVLLFKGESYRILALLPPHVVWIAVVDTKAFPSLILIDDLKEEIAQESISRVLDPYAHLALEMPEEGSVAKEKRDKNYQLIKPLLESDEYYLPKVRSAIINYIISEQGSTKQTLYGLARKYWQRGQIVNALLPDYKNSGAKGKVRTAKEKKLGRPRKYMPGTGVNVDESIKRLFRIAIDKYLLTDKGYSFPYAHRRFKDIYETYFPDTSEEEMPTHWQMHHFYKREYSQAERVSKRVNKIEFNKDVKPLQSTANTQVLGPGSRFEIDATIADVYLVSDADRNRIVGRPVVYFVKDVFSRMIAGFYVGFENPSYVAALQALVMSMTDKVEFCKQLEYSIEEEQWPVIGLCDALLADRGELLGYQIESLENSFSVRIENTPPYRGDAKGIIERTFRTVQADFSPFAPGFVTGTKVKKRGGNDYRLDAKLNVTEFKKIVLGSVLYHNQFSVLHKYDRYEDMPSDLACVPLQLWNWGIKNRTGRLRSVNADVLKVCLLPRAKATISDLGIKLFGVYFTSTEILKLGWLHRSSETSRPKFLEAAYDPAVADHIYLFPNKNSTEYWVCKLADRSREFVHCSFWDVWKIKGEQKDTMSKAEQTSQEQKRSLERFIKQTIQEAVKSDTANNGLSNAEKINQITQNKQSEKDLERKGSGYYPPKSKKKTSAEIVKLFDVKEDDFSYPDLIEELFDEDDD